MKKYRGQPIRISEEVWMYVEKTHLSVIHEIRDTRTPYKDYIRIDEIKIPFRKFIKYII